MFNVDEILAQEIKAIQVLIWNDHQHPSTIELILFDFGNQKLIIQADKDYDTLILEILKDYKIEETEKEHQIIDSSMIHQYGFSDVLGKKIIWLWTLTNNLGYQDGIQIELENRVSIQFIVEASSISVRRWMEILFRGLTNTEKICC